MFITSNEVIDYEVVVIISMVASDRIFLDPRREQQIGGVMN